MKKDSNRTPLTEATRAIITLGKISSFFTISLDVIMIDVENGTEDGNSDFA